MALVKECQASPELLRGFGKCSEELLKQWSGVVGSRCRLGMVLNAKHRKLAMAEPFDRSVVEIHVRDLEVGSAGHRLFIPLNGEAVILRRDQHVTRRDFPDRMISAAVAVRH